MKKQTKAGNPKLFRWRQVHGMFIPGREPTDPDDIETPEDVRPVDVSVPDTSAVRLSSADPATPTLSPEEEAEFSRLSALSALRPADGSDWLDKPDDAERIRVEETCDLLLMMTASERKSELNGLRQNDNALYVKVQARLKEKKSESQGKAQ